MYSLGKVWSWPCTNILQPEWGGKSALVIVDVSITRVFYDSSAKWGLTSLCWANRFLGSELQGCRSLGICQGAEEVKGIHTRR